MRRWLLLVLLLVVGGAAGCDSPARPVDTSWPTLPGTVTIDPDAPRLPETGPIGRGALLLSEPWQHLAWIVLEDGRQFRLPDPPGSEGRWTTIGASLSPNGWWLGYRAPKTAGDDTYHLRHLATGEIVVARGGSPRWSVDSTTVVLIDTDDDGYRYTRLDLRSGATREIPAEVGPRLVGVLPTGDYVTNTATGFYPGEEAPVSCELVTEGQPAVPVQSTAAGRLSCRFAAISPDGRRVTSLGFYVPEPTTDAEKAQYKAETEFVTQVPVVVVDRETGAVLRAATLALPFAGAWYNLDADRGHDLLFRVGNGSSMKVDVVSLDPVTGTQRTLITGPEDVSITLPGHTIVAPDG